MTFTLFLETVENCARKAQKRVEEYRESLAGAFVWVIASPRNTLQLLTIHHRAELPKCSSGLLVDGGGRKTTTRSEKTRFALLYCKWALKKKEAIQLFFIFFLSFGIKCNNNKVTFTWRAWKVRQRCKRSSQNERVLAFWSCLGS